MINWPNPYSTVMIMEAYIVLRAAATMRRSVFTLYIYVEMNDDVPGDPPAMQFNKNSNKNKFQKRSIDILKKWFLDHLENPYPDTAEKMRLSTTTGMHVR